MSTALTISLIILVLVIAASVIALTVYVAKWLIELTLLTKNLNETTTVVKNELEPLLGELSATVKHVNELAENANSQINTVKKIISTVLGALSLFAGKFKFLSSSFMKGFFSAFNLFRKR